MIFSSESQGAEQGDGLSEMAATPPPFGFVKHDELLLDGVSSKGETKATEV